MGIFSFMWFAVKSGYKLLTSGIGLVMSYSDVLGGLSGLLLQFAVTFGLIALMPLLVTLIEKAIIAFKWLLERFE